MIIIDIIQYIAFRPKKSLVCISLPSPIQENTFLQEYLYKIDTKKYNKFLLSFKKNRMYGRYNVDIYTIFGEKYSGWVKILSGSDIFVYFPNFISSEENRKLNKYLLVHSNAVMKYKEEYLYYSSITKRFWNMEI